MSTSVINVELLIREDLTSIAAIGLDLAALHGAGGTELRSIGPPGPACPSRPSALQPEARKPGPWKCREIP